MMGGLRNVRVAEGGRLTPRSVMTANESDPRLRLKEWLASGEAKLLPLSLPQRELWENSPVPPGDPANHICATIELHGTFSFDLCTVALRAVVERQEVLRTSFLSGGGKIAQVVRSKAETILLCREVGSPEGLEEVMAATFSEPFDMVRGPLYRVEMLRVADDHQVLALVFHHAIADGWTLGVFVEDFTAAYVSALREAGRGVSKIRGLREGLPSVGVTYSAWAAAERARWQPAEAQRHLAYWRPRLAGSKPLLEPGNGSPLQPLLKYVTALPPPVVDSTRELARRSGVTLFSALLSAFQIALYRWRGACDVVLGTPHANRTKAGVRDTMGYFAGVVPLRLRLEPGRTFESTLVENHAQVVEDFAHAMPFAELAAAVGLPPAGNRHPIFDVRFALQNHPVPDIVLPGISTRLRTRSTGTSRFDIGCELTEDGHALEVVWLYRPPFLTEGAILHLDQLLRNVLIEAGESPDFRPEQPTS